MTTDPNRRIYALQAEICRGLAHPIRLEVVHLLGRGPSSFGELAAKMRIAKAKLSQHLSVLQRTGIVAPKLDGGQKRYQLNYPEIEAACEALGQALARRLVDMREQTNALLRTVRGGGRKSVA
jgi:ArsR family transcriptional regulator